MDKVKAAGIYAEKAGKVLMVQEKHEPANGLWCVPLGHVDNLESFQQAAIREGKEESGYDFELEGLAREMVISGREFKGMPEDFDKQIEIKIFKGKVAGGQLSFDPSDMLSAAWIPKDEIKFLPLRGDWLKPLFD
ncbi:MAG: NUDIX domain-containing protein [Patescibacteria group bacterium]|nr:NUDIX domain-containing protein [Patescibacteria group bacterium]